MTHLQNMKPVEFVRWVQEIHNAGGVLKKPEVTLKVDGLGARFGKDKDGSFFFEGSNTGPIFNAKAFSTHAKEKGSKQELVDRASHYDDMFDLIKDSHLWLDLPEDTKVVCEIFYNPMGTEFKDGIVFVSVKYDKSKLGSKMTVVPISILVASTGLEHKDTKNILKRLFASSTSKIKIVDPKLFSTDIDLRARIKSVSQFDDDDIRVLQSLKAIDKLRKEALLKSIKQAQNDIAEYLLDHPSIEDTNKLGNEKEGLVFNINGKPIKVTTQKFKDSKKKEA